MNAINYEQFLIDLRKFQNAFQKQLNDELKKLNISMTHVGIIMLLWKKETGYSMTEISRLICVDNALMTRNIKELEAINYIYRNRASEIERKYHICLTEDGRVVANELRIIMKRRQEKFLERFSPKEQEKIAEVIAIIKNKFIINLEKEEKEKEC